MGDAAGALIIGHKNVIAECIGVETSAVDFVDHYRGEESDFDYDWEERWIRDEGYLKLIPPVVEKLLCNKYKIRRNSSPGSSE